MADGKEVLTTGDVARICRVTIRTVIKWFESGRLPGYRIPGSRDRRFPRGAVEEFLRSHDMPGDLLDGGPPAPRASTPSAGPTAPATGPQPRLPLVLPLVLVVDDDPGVRGMTTRYLRTLAGLEVDEAGSGWEAGLKTAARQPRLLLLDYRLEDTTGGEVLATIRQMKGLAQPSIVIMSAHLSDDEAAGLLRDGADGWLPKPFDLDVLRATVFRHLGLGIGRAS